MSLISGSYSRAWGGGGAPDFNEVIVENCLKDGVLADDPRFTRDVRARGARSALDRVADNPRFLVTARTPRLMVDIVVVNWSQRGEFLTRRKKLLSSSTATDSLFSDKAHCSMGQSLASVTSGTLQGHGGWWEIGCGPLSLGRGCDGPE